MLTEYELQKQNMVLAKLEAQMHYTYGVFPGSSVKKNIDLHVFTRQINKIKFECDFDAAAKVNFIDSIRRKKAKEEGEGFDDPFSEMFDLLKRLAKTNVILLCVLPAVGCFSGGWPVLPCASIAMIISFGFICKFYSVSLRINESISLKDSEKVIGVVDLISQCTDRVWQ